MRSVRLLAFFAAVLAAVPALAQQDANFPDVPTNHWAYAALARMKKEGLLVGYPDSLYRGGRPASRYELAVALHAAYTNLRNLTDGIDAQLKALGGTPDAGGLKTAIADLKAQIAAMKGYGADVADLRRASDTFELELTQLGVDTKAMQDALKGLDARVKALETRRPALDISGDLNLWVGGGHTDGRHYGLTRDGRLTGTDDKGQQLSGIATNKAGVGQDVTFLHEAALDFATTNETGPKLHGAIVVTNMFGQGPVGPLEGPSGVAFGNQSDVVNPTGVAGGLFGYSEGKGDVYFENLFVAFEGPRLSVEAGRVEHRATPWIFQRIDNTLYFDNERWDNGLYGFEGAKAKGHVGPVRLEAYGGTDDDRSVNGIEIDPLRSGPAGGFVGGGRMRVARLLGGTVSGSVRGVGLRGDALVLDSDLPGDFTGGGTPYDQVRIVGGEGDFHVGQFKVTGGLRQTQAYDGEDRIGGLAGTSWDARAAWSSGKVDLGLQYREVQTDYLAPGDWGRLGVLRNPTNVRGFIGKARVGLAPRYAVSAEGEISHGLSNNATGGTLLDRDTEIGRIELRFDAVLGDEWNAYARYENTGFADLAGAANSSARYQWYGLGLSKALAHNADFSLAYEQSAIRNDYQTSLGLAGFDFRGGFLTSQVTVRF